jgi:transposase-like protein
MRYAEARTSDEGVDPSTIYLGAQRITPLYQDAARRYRYPVGRVWSVDETYIRVAGQWQYA